MKQDLGSAAGQKPHSAAHPPAVRAARVPKPKESPRGETGGGNPRQVGPEDRGSGRAVKRQPLPFSTRKVRPSDDPGPSPREREKPAPRHGGLVSEQFAKPRRKVASEADRRDGDGGAVRMREKELQERLDASEGLVRALRSEVDALQDLLGKLQSFNDELEAQNRQYADELSLAQEKISALEASQQANTVREEPNVEEFRDASEKFATEPEQVGTSTDHGKDARFKLPNFVQDFDKIQPQVPARPTSVPSIPASSPAKQSPTYGAAAPPPPPPPPRLPGRPLKTTAAPSVVEFYRSLTKRHMEKVTSSAGSCTSPANNKAHNSIVDEIQNRSAHLMAIKSDVATKGSFIKFLIEKVHSSAFNDIEDVSEFVDWLDNELSTLADERAVLKHFDWPEKKADAMREAAIEYRVLRQLEVDVCSFADDPTLPPEIALKKMANLLDKLERGIQRVINLRNVASMTFMEFKIPTDWMLDSGMPRKIKLASIELAKLCMRRVSMELESVRHSEREMIQEALLLRCVHFAYRVHQFAGGLDYEAMSVLGELRGRIQTDGCLKKT